MKTIKITKEQLNKLLSMNNPLIIYKDGINEGDRIICENTNEIYLVIESYTIDVIKYNMFAYIKVKVDHIDGYDGETNKERNYPDPLYFTTIYKLEKIIKSKEIDLNLLEHK